MKLATWNVNGIRARGEQVAAWIEKESPDVLCLQELKSTADQVPESLRAREGYHALWHGHGPYSGVALLLKKASFPEAPRFSHPAFDHETRIVVADVDRRVFASVYVPNGGKDLAPKLAFLDALAAWARELHAAGKELLLAGDVNVAREDRDIHPKERSPKTVGQLPVEREKLSALLATGLVDVGRALDPDNDALFTWWAPWRQHRQRNLGWRIDYVLVSESVAKTATSSRVERETGTSDHAPVLVELGP